VFCKVLDNYIKWCRFLGKRVAWTRYSYILWAVSYMLLSPSMWAVFLHAIKSLDAYLLLPFFGSLEAVNKNRKIILVALYFLIWGEAANVRFLPECLCYIFHNVSPFLSNVDVVSEGCYVEQYGSPIGRFFSVVDDLVSLWRCSLILISKYLSFLARYSVMVQFCNCQNGCCISMLI
jgi:hypothetical protein